MNYITANRFPKAVDRSQLDVSMHPDAEAPQTDAFALPEVFSTVIGVSTRFNGDLQADESSALDLKVDGALHGSVVIPTGGIVLVGATGTIKGERIEADHIVVHGNVEATIVSRKGIEIASGAVVKGAIEYHGTLEIRPHSRVNAAISFGGQA